MATALMSAGIIFSLFPFSSPAIHSLKYQFMATSGIPTFPQFAINGYVDDMMAFHYDSETKRVVPRQSWIEDSLSADYWNTETQKAHGAEQVFRSNIEILKGRFNQTRGVHTVQFMFGCQWDDESGQTNGFMQYGYDGEDFLSLDVKNKRWISPVLQAVVTANKWNRNTPELEMHNNYLTNVCTDWLKKYVQYGQNTLRRTVPPNVSMFKRQGTGPVFCHATGFYPEGVMITWNKAGVEIQDDVDVDETLPDEDGTFQKRAVLMLSSEELQGNKYTCEVAHSSGIQTMDYFSLETSSTPPLGLLLGVLIGSLILLSCVIFVIWRRRMYCDNLKKKSVVDYIQPSKYLDPASKTDPDVISRSSDDSESPTPSVSSLDSVSSDQPLMKKRPK